MVKIEFVKDINGHEHLMFILDRFEIFQLMTKNKFGPGVCDSCCSSLFDEDLCDDEYMYLIPDLRDTHCIKCSKSYFNRMKHYKEDIPHLIEYIKQAIDYFEFSFSKEEKEVIENHFKYLNELQEMLPVTD